MEHVLNFFARVGDVTLGIICAIMLIAIVILLIIELIDFLIVDPIARAKQHEPNETSEED